ncbi:NAD(P)/FAD-dependent oxidoreductase [Allorhizobium undicola]|uniref:NAD(P)/FAD-dependent oxidoreductase n=1 Tax=Allorhizobium undicola TaxID=78527 RepID=UPI003D341FBD
MASPDRPARVAGQPSRPVLVIGGGIMGLWAALKVARAGFAVTLAERGRVGQGASGGLLGALMAHMPDRWNEKKQFQFEALLSLEDEIARLESETGMASGYRRSGRLIPLPKPHLREIALGHERDARQVWQAPERGFEWRVVDEAMFGEGWPQAHYRASGLVFDTLAGRVFPRSVTALVRAGLQALTHVTLLEGIGIRAIDARNFKALCENGDEIAFSHVIVAGGVEAFRLIEGLRPWTGKPLGMGVKGQSALLRAPVDPALPLIYLDGLYVVPHEGGMVAIGSTSENSFDAPFTTDGQVQALIERATEMVPALEGAEVVERWAGLRPKAIGRDPMVGAHPEFPHVIALGGGFKVSFGIAHKLAEAACAALKGEDMRVPESFHLARHLEMAASKR